MVTGSSCKARLVWSWKAAVKLLDNITSRTLSLGQCSQAETENLKNLMCEPGYYTCHNQRVIISA